MKISFKVEAVNRSHAYCIDIPVYYNADEVIHDLQKMVDYHKLKADKFKRDFIERWGEKEYNERLEKEKF